MRVLSIALAATIGIGAWLSPAFAESPVKVGDVKEGPNATPWTGLVERTDEATGKKRYQFFGRNRTGKLLLDFELELKNCGGKAKFYRIKVYPRAVFDKTGRMTEVRSDADWDVDDNLNGSGEQGTATEPGGKSSNETDNVDDSPDVRARTDAGGQGDPNCCGKGYTEAQGAVAAGTEDPGERNGGVGADGKDGVKPDDGFILEIELTAPPEGAACGLSVTPSFGLTQLMPQTPLTEEEMGPIPLSSEQEQEETTPSDPPPPEEPKQDGGSMSSGTGDGIVQSACPEGQSGGWLAGTINSLFGTSIAGLCDDEERQTRDRGGGRDRPDHDRGGED